MRGDTFETTIRKFQKRHPFEPFFVELSSGERVTVDHPEALVIRSGVGVFLDSTGALSIFDHDNISQISSRRTPAKGGGSRR